MTWTDWTNEGVESAPEDYVDDDLFDYVDEEEDTYFDWNNH